MLDFLYKIVLHETSLRRTVNFYGFLPIMPLHVTYNIFGTLLRQ